MLEPKNTLFSRPPHARVFFYRNSVGHWYITINSQNVCTCIWMHKNRWSFTYILISVNEREWFISVPMFPRIPDFHTKTQIVLPTWTGNRQSCREITIQSRLRKIIEKWAISFICIRCIRRNDCYVVGVKRNSKPLRKFQENILQGSFPEHINWKIRIWRKNFLIIIS